nr:response regulator transcription factor [Rubeoparvulum massiliense]
MKVVIVDDQTLVRKGMLSLLIPHFPKIHVEEATTMKEARQLLQHFCPDLLVTRMYVKDGNALTLLKYVKGKGFQTKVIILNSKADLLDFRDAKEAGVDGFVLKTATPEELVTAIQLVSQGGKYYDSRIMELMMNRGKISDSLSRLTVKELEVLKALGEGLSNRDIASRLYISEYTVKKHVSQILDKLQVADRTQAALYANMKGIVRYQYEYQHH